MQLRLDGRDVALDDARLSDGFWEPERDASGWTWRWTNGRATLPLAALAGEVACVEMTLDTQVLQYWIAPESASLRTATPSAVEASQFQTAE